MPQDQKSARGSDSSYPHAATAPIEHEDPPVIVFHDTVWKGVGDAQLVVMHFLLSPDAFFHDVKEATTLILLEALE